MAKKKSPSRKTPSRRAGGKATPVRSLDEAVLMSSFDSITDTDITAFAAYTMTDFKTINKRKRQEAAAAVIKFATLGWQAYAIMKRDRS